MKIIIAGGREFNNLRLLAHVCDFLLKEQTDIEIISGMARGADKLGAYYAKMRGYKVIEKPAPWDEIEGKPSREIRINPNGKKYWILAGNYRNNEMADEGDALIAFWDGKSKGTKSTISIAKEQGKKVFVYWNS